MKNTFSLRAECAHDVNEFKRATIKQSFDVEIRLNQRDPGFPDTSIEFTTKANLEELRTAIRTIVDGHVMLQTLRQCPLLDNSGERDYDLE